ncbi:hypothetical protein [Streptomyces sp. NPDC059893]
MSFTDEAGVLVRYSVQGVAGAGLVVGQHACADIVASRSCLKL